MNAYTQIAIKTKTTQVTMHRGNQRLWLQNARETLEAGFIPHAQYRTDYLADSIVLTLTTEGKTRRVSKCGRGATLDINNRQLKVGGKYDFSNGIRWNFQAGVITIKPMLSLNQYNSIAGA
tara:strand:- start:28 stop:390 length:363 start_codon:yes stop_codon:yes gene_type:complete